MESSYFVRIMREIAPKYGAKIIPDTSYGYAGYIEFATGRRFFFNKGAFDINHYGAANLAKDKDYTRQFIIKFGYNVPEQEIIFSPQYRKNIARKSTKVAATLNDINAALSFAKKHSFPLYVKPNDESGGIGVAKVQNKEQLMRHVENLFAEHEKVLVETACVGRDYRVVVLDEDILLSYERRPFSIVGDGTSTIEELIHTKINNLREQGRSPNIEETDSRIEENLKMHGLTQGSILEENCEIILLDHANLSAGASAHDITKNLSPRVLDLCIKVMKDMGLTFGAIDLIAPDLTKSTDGYRILEINSRPGFQHFREGTPHGKERVALLYEKLLAYMSTL